MYLIMVQSPKIIHLNSDLTLSRLSLLFAWTDFHQHMIAAFLSLQIIVKLKITVMLQITLFNQLLLNKTHCQLFSIVFTRTMSSIFSHLALPTRAGPNI